jgi:hypothetical protein
MSVLFTTTTPQQLLRDFKAKIDKREVVTWRYDAAGDFTHSADQWDGKGWMRPVIDLNGLRFNFIGTTGVVTTWPIFGIYQGRLIESFVTHCHDLFRDGSATSKPTNTDVVVTQAVGVQR